MSADTAEYKELSVYVCVCVCCTCSLTAEMNSYTQLLYLLETWCKNSEVVFVVDKKSTGSSCLPWNIRFSIFFWVPKRAPVPKPEQSPA